MKPRHSHYISGILGTHHVRDHNPRGIQLQRHNVVAVAATLDPDQDVQVMSLGRPYLLLNRLPVVSDMLEASPEAICSAEGSYFRAPSVRLVFTQQTTSPARSFSSTRLRCMVIGLSFIDFAQRYLPAAILAAEYPGY